MSNARLFRPLVALLGCCLYAQAAHSVLVSAVLPSSRSVQVGSPVTVFATLLNTGTESAANCRPALGSPIDISLRYQTTDAATNLPTGTVNTPVTLAGNSGQSWLLELTANAEFAPADLVVDFICDNVDPPQNLTGVNTVLISATNSATADIVALSATVGGNGILETTANQAAAFSVASVNVGASATLVARPVAQGTSMDSLSICQTDPVSAECLAASTESVTVAIGQNETPTFSIFMQHSAEIAFAPAANRISVVFEEGGVARGSTSVAVSVGEGSSTPPSSPPVTPDPPMPQSQPNILLIISDDQGLDAASQYSFGNDLPNTPTLDQLANSGVVFDNAWATPSCVTTRATMLTGLHGVNSGVVETPGRIEIGAQILQQTIRDNTDYATAVFGKWHVGGGNSEATHPNDLGVGHYAGNITGNIAGYFDWNLTINGQTEATTEYHTSKITDLARDWIDEQNTPWFAWVAYTAPHSPFHLPPADLHSSGLPGGAADIASREREYYLAAMEALDTEVARLLAGMTQAERDNTLIIFTGDNGTPRSIIDTQAFDRTHSKGSLYQGGIGVPMFVSGAGVSRTGERDSSLIASTDMYATIAEITGVTTAAPADSKSFVSTFSVANSGPRTFSYSENEGNASAGWTVRNARYKLIVLNNGTEELYELPLDPDEQNNLLPGDAALMQVREELFAFGAMTRGEAFGPSTATTALDITDTLLTNRSGNCQDYVSGYRSDALDVNNSILLEGDLVISVVADKCVFTTNLVPNHSFNDGAQSFPNPVSPQDIVYSVTTTPMPAASTTGLTLTTDNAILLNGAKVDLLVAACFGVGDGLVGCDDMNQPWRFDPMFAANNFHVDSHNAHSQPDGSYHYHGTPNALFSNTPEAESPVIGFAADGYPIFGTFFNDGTGIREAQSSYQLRSGPRPSDASDPGGTYDGTYRDDYEFVSGSGDLDACNGMVRDGVYGYYVTQRFPYVLGCFTGTPDSSFNK